MFESLLRNLPGFFDRDPEPVLALRVQHALSLRWHIGDTTLTLSVGDAAPVTLDLQAYTCASLAQHLATQGFIVAYQNPGTLNWSAARLIPNQGIPGQTGRPYSDGWYVADSILWAHLRALAQELGLGQQALDAMLRQLILPNAREEWADYWGWHFGMPRLPGESDADYTQRIIDEFYRARNNPAAMLKNVRRYTGYDIELFEPWTRMWTLSRSGLSRGDDHLPSGNYYAYHWLHPIARQRVDWDAILPVLEADRPAGTLLITPSYWFPPGQIDGGADNWTIQKTEHHLRMIQANLIRCGILSDNLTLSQHCIVRNWLIAQLHLHTAWVYNNNDTIGVVLPPRTFCLGEIVLSEAPPLGDLNARFAGRRWIEEGGPLRLSLDPLSDYVWRGHWQSIDEWIDGQAPVASYLTDWPETALITSAHQQRLSSATYWRTPGVLDVDLALSAHDPQERHPNFSHIHIHAWQLFAYQRLRQWSDPGVWNDDRWYARDYFGLTSANIIPPRTFCLGEIVLSDSAPMGDLQARFPGRQRTEIGNPLALGGGPESALSDYAHELIWTPVDSWPLPDHD